MFTAAPMRDDREGYGLVTRTLHWGMAALFAWQFTTGIVRVVAEDSPVDAFFWSTHYSVGFTLFCLVVLRGLWGLANLHRRPPHAGPSQERLAASLGQLLLYGLMIVIPPLMIVRAIGLGRGFTVYGVQLVAPGEPWADRATFAPLADAHVILAWTLLACIVLHAAIALYHGFVRRDATLDRMVKGSSALPLNPGPDRP
ncbi:cytochrome b [Aureimonas endophytica]|uniref:Cytochrome b n=1 Tax=Aureimonas endophytica TaxID=2027858 RepID=A0A916ZX25_9HYPH|nr:cytochrome b [Aureimonas endophytica]GGE17044.1 cytochrome b [Aureimonas endophytica]